MKKQFWAACIAAAALMGTSCSQGALLDEALELNAQDSYEEFSGQYSTLTERDSLALISIYKATAGDNWHRNENWLTKAPLESWAGVQIKEINGVRRVWALWLGGNKLVGEFPATFKLLNELRVLQLRHNYELTGSIPEEIYSLTKLRTLDLGFCSITGGLSPRIGNLTELDSLDLWTGPWDLVNSNGNYIDNPRRMSGELPKELGRLKKARLIRVRNQNFSGQLPEELGGLASVEELSLERCAFTGEIPKSLGQLKNMKILYLAGNKLTGEIPNELCDATALEELILRENQLTGGLPKDIQKWQKLNLLNLSDNQLSGQLPDNLAQMKDLFTFDVRNNKFEGSLPKDFGGEQQDFLRFVDIRDNNFSGELPKKVLHRLRNMDPKGYYPFSPYFYTEYHISGNRFTGELPELYQRVDRESLVPQQAGYGFSNYK